jgi:hypothetical protein
MNPYICKYGLVHHKPCKPANENGKLVLLPSSNNGWIYSAYLNALLPGGYMTSDAVYYACQKQISQDPTYFVYRLPQKKFPPISRDEIIGMVSLGYYPLEYQWFMYRQQAELKIKHYLKAAWQLFTIRNEHRNTFWQNEMYDTFPLSMKLAWFDRYYIASKTGMRLMLWTWMFYSLMFHLYAFSTIIKGSTSEKNILWLQLKDLKSKFLIRFLNYKKNFKDYFPADHPIVRATLGDYNYDF